MRSTRNQPFCWQEKKILRLFKNNFEGMELAKHITLYTGITWLDSDFNGKSIKWYSKTLANRTGLSIKWIPGALKALVELKIIEIVKHRNKEGVFIGSELIFTPENIDENIKITDEEIEAEQLGNHWECKGLSSRQKADSGLPTSGQMPPIEDSLLLEDSKKLEDNHVHVEDHDFFDKLFEEISGGELRYHSTNQEAVKKLMKTMTRDQVAEYIISNYESLKENQQVKNINGVFTELLVNGRRQITTKSNKEGSISSDRQKGTVCDEAPKMNPKFDTRGTDYIDITDEKVKDAYFNQDESLEIDPEDEKRALKILKQEGTYNFFMNNKSNKKMYINALKLALAGS